jgi:hypothetical protein
VPGKDKDGDFDEQEGGEIEMRSLRGLKKVPVLNLDSLSDPGPSLSERGCSDEDHEGGEELYDDSESCDEYEGSTETAYDGGSDEGDKAKKIDFDEDFCRANKIHEVDGEYFE